jgi:hypothetical protein
MARFPGVVWAPLPEAGAPDGYTKTQFIVHSTGDNGTAAATARYFGGATPNESTFIIGQGPHDPTLQIMDSSDRADANVSASIRAISVEVVGDGKSGYNAWQRSEIIRIGIEARKHHPEILPRICPAHDAAGYGWHVMFGAPGPWAGVAKICPGPVRIQELKDDIFPAIFAGQLAQEDDMYGPDEKAFVEARLPQIVSQNAAIVNALNTPDVGVLALLGKILTRQATQSADVDEKALAKEVIAGLAPMVAAAVGTEAGLTEEKVREITEQVVRGVFEDAAS